MNFNAMVNKKQLRVSEFWVIVMKTLYFSTSHWWCVYLRLRTHSRIHLHSLPRFLYFLLQGLASQQGPPLFGVQQATVPLGRYGGALPKLPRSDMTGWSRSIILLRWQTQRLASAFPLETPSYSRRNTLHTHLTLSCHTLCLQCGWAPLFPVSFIPRLKKPSDKGNGGRAAVVIHSPQGQWRLPCA